MMISDSPKSQAEPIVDYHAFVVVVVVDVVVVVVVVDDSTPDKCPVGTC